MDDRLKKAFLQFNEIWEEIKAGDFYSNTTNDAFEYLLKSLINTEYKTEVKKEILQSLGGLEDTILSLEDMPPFFYILLSIKDQDITKAIEDMIISYFKKEKGSQRGAFQVVNLCDILAQNNQNFHSFIKNAVSLIDEQMDLNSIDAMAGMLCMQYPDLTKYFIHKFAEMENEELLTNLINIVGKEGILKLLETRNTIMINKILKKVKGKK